MPTVPGTSMRLAEIADLLGAELIGDGEAEILRPASLSAATAADIAYYADPRLAEALSCSRAGAVLLADADRQRFPGNRLVVADPQLAFATLCEALTDPQQTFTGRDPSARIDPSALVSPGAAVAPYAVIGAGARVASGATIGAHAVLESGVEVGADSRIGPRVVVHHDCRIGSRCSISAGAVIGSTGFGYAETANGWRRMPHVGRVLIGDDVDVGANTTIDRGRLDDTVIEDGVKLDNLIQVAHNVRIGAATAIAGCTGIAGSARIGRRCKIGGRASILGHLTICDDVVLQATTVVTRSIMEPGVYSSNLDALPARRWRKVFARLSRIDELFRRVRQLEQRERSSDDG